MEIPFDNNSGEKYVFNVDLNEIEGGEGDGILLSLNKKACESFAILFSRLAAEGEGGHIHLGYSEQEPQGPGIRISLCEDL